MRRRRQHCLSTVDGRIYGLLIIPIRFSNTNVCRQYEAIEVV